MTYQQSLSFLFGLQKYGIKFGLTKISKLLSNLDNPQRKLDFIHIAGTNGKGSTAAFLASTLSQADYKIGVYTSPHLTSFTERIKINSEEISKKDVIRLTALLRRKAESIKDITFFEFVTAMAIYYFAEKQPDISILEVGMGGRLDATNVVNPLVSIITNISKEHEYYLGNTLYKIAYEKAGIIKKNSTLITGVTQPRIRAFYSKKCKSLNSQCYILGRDFYIRRSRRGGHCVYRGINENFKNIAVGLRGDHQLLNAALALSAIEVLRGKDYPIKDSAIYRGLSKVAWPGRFEVVAHSPRVVLDGAHNPSAMKSLSKTLKKSFDFRHLILVIGIMEDKNIKGMLREILPYAHRVILCRPQMERAASTSFLADVMKPFKVESLQVESVRAALKRALSAARKNDIVCVTGSLFTVGEARSFFNK